MSRRSIQEIFQKLPAKLDQEAAEGLSAIYQFELSGPQGGEYYLSIDQGACEVIEGTHPEPQVTLAMTSDDCLGVLNGQLNGQSVFMAGRLRITGDLGLAMQLKMLFPAVG